MNDFQIDSTDTEVGVFSSTGLYLDETYAQGPRSRLIIGVDRDRPEHCAIKILSLADRPNWWHRLWHWALLGWKWERVGD